MTCDKCRHFYRKMTNSIGYMWEAEMKVPKYIRKKMHQIAFYAGMAASLDRYVGLWLEAHGIDVESISDGDGSSFEELMYGNDVTDELCARIERMEEKL